MRLPASILPVGDVAVTIPVGPGAVAHRLDYYNAPAGKDRHGDPQYVRVPKPRCRNVDPNPPDGIIPRFAEHSAGWADKHGATACTQCFTEEN